MGIIQQPDTLEELADKLLMPTDALKATGRHAVRHILGEIA
ncbi:hypothetical protein [uncultured Adlercreutzia sp.]|nr:hypothetical protein [uncultured Adlercreutzia sp.]